LTRRAFRYCRRPRARALPRGKRRGVSWKRLVYSKETCEHYLCNDSCLSVVLLSNRVLRVLCRHRLCANDWSFVCLLYIFTYLFCYLSVLCFDLSYLPSPRCAALAAACWSTPVPFSTHITTNIENIQHM
jgi:hypothetical protein